MKYCRECGTALEDDVQFCPKCGHRQNINYQTGSINVTNVNNQHQRLTDTSSASLILGILSIVLGILFFPSFLGLVLGIIGTVIDKTKSRRGLTITGIVISSISFIILFAFTIIWIIEAFYYVAQPL